MKKHETQPKSETNETVSNTSISKSFWIKLVFIPVAMFGFAFALVPLYDVFCEITGLNGRTTNSVYQGIELNNIDHSRKITVDFMSSTSPGFPIKFYPKEKSIEIFPGKIYTINYIAENRSDTPIIGQAIPSVAPSLASVHFKKLECFCFTNQTFEPKVPVEMPVKFFVDSKLDENVKNITLSYNFFMVKNSDQQIKNNKLNKTDKVIKKDIPTKDSFVGL